jgi:O-antigen/teichoic acid export membrane protein
MAQAGLATLAERALKWSALTTIARFALQLAAQIALARMLGPENFGIYGIGMVILTFAAFLAGGSFSWNLMLLPTVTRDDIRFAFTWQMMAGTLCAAAMFAAAPAIAIFFSDPRVEGMVQLLSLACLLMAAASPASCLLQRDLNFRVLGLIQLAGYAAGYLAVGVPMAMHGYGAYALGAACVVQSAVTLVGVYAARPHSLHPLFSHGGGAAAFDTGRTVFITNVVNWLLGNLDRVLIGRVLNAHAVGLYTVAYNLASIPNTLLVSALQPAFLATGAKLQNDPKRLAQGWLLALACILVLVTPASVILALLSADLVSLLYGRAWMESAWVLAVLFLCLPAWACLGLTTPVLWNTGRKHQEFMLQLPLLAVAGPVWWVFAPSGIRGIALVSAVVIFARALVIVGAALNALQLRWLTILPYAIRGLGLAAVGAVAVLAGQHAVASLTFPGVSLYAGGACALAAMLLLIAVRPQVLGLEARSALARLVPSVGHRLAPAGAVAGETTGQTR